MGASGADPREPHRAVDAYVDEILFQKGFNDTYTKRQLNELGRLADWMEGMGLELGDLRQVHVNGFVEQEVAVRELAAVTHDNLVSHCKMFLRWLHATDTCDGEPYVIRDLALKIPRPKKPKPLPRYILPEDLRRLLRQPGLTDPLGIRDWAMLEVSYGAGLRPGECVGLRLSRLDVYREEMEVTGKGALDRKAILSPRAVEALSMYLDRARPRLVDDYHGPTIGKPHDRVFVTRRGAPMTLTTWEYRFKRYALRAGLVPPPTPHALRHSIATHLYAAGMDLADIQALLGHRSIMSTVVYAKTSMRKVREEYRNAYARIDEAQPEVMAQAARRMAYEGWP